MTSNMPPKPQVIWNKTIPSSDLKASLKEYSWTERRTLKQSSQEIPHLIPFLISSDTPVPACIVCPGGGYRGRAQHEGQPIAEWLNSLGISAFVLNYRVAPFHHPVPFLDAQRAVRFVRFHAQRFNILPDKIGMIGFSAGGHLTSTIGTLAEKSWFTPNYSPDEIDHVSPLLNYMILCYPVISLRNETHAGSVRNLLGKKVPPELIAQLSTDEQVSSKTPATFIWTTKTDPGVPCSNTERFNDALAKHNISHEMHIFSSGNHGLGLAKNHPEVSQWPQLCANWLAKQLK